MSRLITLCIISYVQLYPRIMKIKLAFSWWIYWFIQSLFSLHRCILSFSEGTWQARCFRTNSSVPFSSVPFSSVQFSAVQCSSVQCSSVQFSSVQCSAVQFSSVQFSAVQFSAVQFSSVQFSAAQCGAVQFISKIHLIHQLQLSISIYLINNDKLKLGGEVWRAEWD